jgi:hypothetical protein
MNQLGELAFHIWDIEFGDHSTALERERNALLISGYLEANLGQLNTLINTDFYLDKDKDKVSPPLQHEEKAIFTQLYLKDYMNKQARNLLRNAATSASSTTVDNNNTENITVTAGGVSDWVELREGDTSIKRAIVTSTETARTQASSAKVLQQSAQETNQLLKELIHAYNVYGSIPLQVVGQDIGVSVETYQRREEPNAWDEILTIKEQFDNLNKDFNRYSSNVQSQLNQIKLDIDNQKIDGYSKVIPLPIGVDEIYVDWSEEFNPPTPPTVLATLRSLSEDDPLILYRLEGGVSLGGARFVFGDKITTANYALDVAAFSI